MKSTARHGSAAGHRRTIACPGCQEPAELRKRGGRFRCARGHSYPIETLIGLEERRFVTVCGWPITALERLEADLGMQTATGRVPGGDRAGGDSSAGTLQLVRCR